MTDINKLLKDIGSGKVKAPASSGKSFENALNFDRESVVVSGTDFKAMTGTDFEHVQDILGPNFNLMHDDNIKMQLGEKQSKLDQFVGAMNQGLIGEIIGGTIEGIGYLGDLRTWGNAVAQEEGVYTNALAEFGKSIREATQEATPIFKDEAEGEFSPGEFSYWMSGVPSMFSTLSLMIPAGGAIKGLSYAARGSKIASKLQGLRGTKLALKSAGHAVLSRHGENMMEASQAYEGAFRKALDAGKSTEEAKKIAGTGAAFSYNLNWAMLAQDIVQSYMLFKTGAPVSKLPTNEMAKKLGISTLEASAKKFGKYGLNHAGEALEEGYQYVVGKEAERVSDEMLGITDTKSFSSRLKEYLKDGEMHTAMVFGALGSGVTQGVFNLINKKALSADQKARIEHLENRGTIMASHGKKINKLIEEGASDVTIQDAQDEAAIDVALQGSMVENYQFTREHVESVAEMSQEEKEALNLQHLDGTGLSRMLEIMDSVSKDFAKNRIKYEGSTADFITRYKAMAKISNERVERAVKNYEENLSSLPNSSKMTDFGREYLNKKAQFNANKHIIDILSKRIADIKADKSISAEERESLVKQHEKTLSLHEGKKARTEKSLKSFERDRGQLSKEDKDIIDNDIYVNELTGPKVGEIANLEFYDKYNNEVKKATSKEFQAEIAKQKEEALKKYKEEQESSLSKVGNFFKRNKDQDKDKELNKEAEETAETVKDKKKQKKEQSQEVDEQTGQPTPPPPSAPPQDMGGMMFDDRGVPIPLDKRPGAVTETEQTTEEAIVESAAEAEEQVAESYEQVQDSKDSNESVETVSHIETEQEEQEDRFQVTSGYDLAWISSGSTSESLSLAEKEKHRELSKFIENPKLDVTKYGVVYSVDLNNLERKNEEALKAFKAFKSGKLETFPQELVGFLPVKAEIVDSGTGNLITDSKGEVFTLHVHDIDFEFAPEHAEEAVKQTKAIKNTILQGEKAGIKFAGRLVSKQGGHLLKVDELQNLAEVLENPANMSFLVADKNKSLINHNAEQDLSLLGSNVTPGAVYIKGVKGDGSTFPFRTMVSNLTESEAELVLGLYTIALNNPSTLNKPLSNKLIDRIKSSSPIISEMPINFGSTKLSELIDELVYQGEKFTKHKGKHALYIKNGFLHIGGEKYNGTQLQGEAKEFAMEILRNKNRQVNRKKLNNGLYKNYLVKHNILQGNFGVTDYGINFVQTTVRVGELEEFKGKLTKKSKPVVPNTDKTDVSKRVDESTAEAAQQTSEVEYYEGNITPEPNTVFVFGSNPEGRHGAGAAKIAKNKFGAKYGQGEGLQGNAYALPTKDLRVKENRGFKSISPQQITQSIKNLYETSKQNPNKQFKVAYRNTTETSLNGYTGLEMIDMFNDAGSIPSNVIFSKEWFDTGKLNNQPTQTSDVKGSEYEAPKPQVPDAAYKTESPVKTEITEVPQVSPEETSVETKYTKTSEAYTDNVLNLDEEVKIEGLENLQLADFSLLSEKNSLLVFFKDNSGKEFNLFTVYNDLANKSGLYLQQKNDSGSYTGVDIKRNKLIELLEKGLSKEFTNFILDYSALDFKKKDIILNNLLEIPSRDMTTFEVVNTAEEYKSMYDETIPDNIKSGVEKFLLPYLPHIKNLHIINAETNINAAKNDLTREKGIVLLQELKGITPDLSFLDKKTKQVVEEGQEEFEPLDDSLQLVDSRGKKVEEKDSGTKYESLDSLEQPVDSRGVKTFNSEENGNSKKEEHKGISDFKSDKYNNDSFSGLFKLSDVPVNNKPEVVQREAEYLKTLLPNDISILIEDDYVNLLRGGQLAVGMFYNNIISIYNKAGEGVAYHEGFHAVFNSLLTAQERSAILEESKKTRNFNEKDIQDTMIIHGVSKDRALDILHEEAIADEFALFLQSPESYTFKQPKSRNLFQRLLTWIKSVFSNDLTAKKLFKDIKSGEYAKRPVSLSRDMRFKLAQEFTEDEVDEIVNQLSFVLFQKANSPSNSDELMDTEFLKGFLKFKFDEAMKVGDVDTATNFNNVFENVDFFEKKVKDFLFELGIKSINDLTSNNETNLDEELKEDDGSLDSPVPVLDKFTKSSKDSSNNTTKLLIALLPELNSNKLVNGKLDYNTEGTYLGLPKFASYGQSWNLLKNVTKDIVTYTKDGEIVEAYPQIVEAVRGLSVDFPRFQTLLDGLERANDYEKSSFVAGISGHLFPFETGLINNVGNRNIELQFISSTNGDNAKKVINDWSTNFINNAVIMEDGNKVYSKATTGKIVDGYTELVNGMISRVSNEIKTGKHNAEAFNKDINKTQEVLASMGIQTGVNTINRLVDNNYSRMTSGVNKEAANRYSALYSFLTDDMKHVFDEINNSANKPVGKNRMGTDILSIIENENAIKEIAKVHAYFNESGSEANSKGPEGKSYYNYGDHNNITLSLAQWKNSPEMLDELLSTPWGSNSVWAQYIKRGQFEETAPINIKQEDEGARDPGRKVPQLNKKDYLFTVFNSYLQGRFVGLAEADKSTQFWFKGPKVLKSGVTSLELFNNGRVTVNLDSNKNAVGAFRGYLISELTRMHSVWNNLYGENPLDETQLVKNLHYTKKPGDSTAENPAKGLKSHLFSNEKLVELGLVSKESEDGKPGKPHYVTLQSVKNNVKVNAYLKKVFNNLVNSDMTQLLSNDIFEVKGNHLNAKNVSKKVREEYEEIAEAKFGKNNVGHNAAMLMISDFTLNSVIANVESTKLFTGDPALFKESGGDLFGDFNKRIPLINASGTLATPMKDAKGNWLVRPKYKSATGSDIIRSSKHILGEDNIANVSKISGMSEEELKEVYAPYDEVETTDAQAYITASFYRERMISYGEWSTGGENSHEAIHNKIIAGESVTPVQMKKLLAQPLKVVHPELKVQNGNQVTHYNKQSEFPLYPNITKGTDLDNLRIAMENPKTGTDHFVFGSGKKAGASGVIDIVDENNDILSADKIVFNTQLLDTTRSFLQQNLKAKGSKNSAGVGSQLEKNVTANVPLEVNEKIYELDGQRYTPLEFVTLYHETVSEISDHGLNEFLKIIKSEEGQINEGALYDYVKAELGAELNEGQKEALDRRIPFKAIPGLGGKLEQKIMSLLKSKSVTLTHMGGAAIQVSGVGMNSNRFTDMNSADKEGILWLKEQHELKPPVVEEIDGELVVKKAEILLPYKYISMIPGHENMSANEILENIDESILEGVMYRIPNQGPSSSDAFKIVGILPETSGDSIITYDEVTTKTGADFDIDKLFYMIPHVIYSKKDNKLIPANRGIKGVKNKRLNIMKELITHPTNYVNLTAPLDNNRLLDLANELFKSEVSKMEMSFFSAINQMNNKINFDNAKGLVGAIANFMTTNSFGQYKNLLLSDGVQVAGEYYNTMFKVKDGQGNYISSTLNDYMNAIVDAAKDPYISRMNVNFNTGNALFSMLCLGIDRKLSALLVGSPVVKLLVDKTQDLEGKFVTSEDDNAVRQVENILRSIHPERYDAQGNFMPSSWLADNPAEAVISILEQNILTGNLDPDVFYFFREMQQLGRQVSNVIKGTKATVNGAGKSVIEANAYINNIEATLDTNMFENLGEFLGFEEDTLDFYSTEDNYVAAYIRNSVLQAVDNIGPALGVNVEEINKLARMFGDVKGTDVKLQSLIEKETNAIRLSREGSPLKIDRKKQISLFSRKGLVSSIEDAKFNEMNPLHNNKFIKQLSTQKGNASNPSFVYINNTSKKDPKEKESLKRAWLEIYNEDSELGKDLVLYTYHTTNFNFGIRSLTDLVPEQILKDMGYYEFVESPAYREEVTYDELSQFARNNADAMHIFKDINENAKVGPSHIEVSDASSYSPKDIIKKEDGTIMVKNKKAYQASLRKTSAGLFAATSDRVLNELFVGYSSEGAEFRRFVRTNNKGTGVVRYFELVGTTKPNYLSDMTAVEATIPLYREINLLGYYSRGNSIKEYNITEDSMIPSNNKVQESNKLKENISKLKEEDSVVREFLSADEVDFDALVESEAKLDAKRVEELIKKCEK